MDERDSDSDSGQGLESSSRESAAQDGSSAAEEADMEVKYCSVLLNRFDLGDEMNRRLSKPVSRIPTFHKKTTTITTTTMEASQAKTPEVKERSLPTPTIRFTSSDYTGEETMTTTSSYSFTHIAAPRTIVDSYVTVSPRAGIRAGREWNLQVLEQSKTRSGSEEPEERGDGGGRGDNDDDDEGGRGSEEQEELFITEEQPPWESQTADTELTEDVRSYSEPDSEEEPTVPQPEAELIQSEAELIQSEAEIIQSEAEIIQSESNNMESNPTETRLAEEEEPAPSAAPNTEADKQEKWSCCSLLVRCVVPLLLLLVGGLSQHLWLYGLPQSVAQLGAQMELHWLEGIVPVTAPCSSDCRVSLVESIPVGLYPSAPALRDSIAQSWLRLLDRVDHSADIAAFYVTLRSPEGEPTDAQGRLVFEKLKSLSSKGVNVRVAVNAPQSSTQDTEELTAQGAEVRAVNLTALTGGIIHTKLWTLDQTHLYLGSANMDWRSLSQVKEVGVAVEDCSCLAQDVSRVFEVYWSCANGSLPPYWPARLSALSSSQNPLQLKINGVPGQVYLSSAPPLLSTRGRTDDLAAILSVMEDAQQFIHVSVMDYIPQSLYSKPPRFWPPLDSALRSAACSRRLQVRLLVSCWPQSKSAMFVYLQSLLVLNRPPLNCDIQVKVFTVPSTPEQSQIPYARVNHAKFMVTDRVVYIGTSNWSEDYFTQTAGVGLVVNQTGAEPGADTLQSQAEQLFLRDWTSEYSTDLSVDQTDACPMGRS